ncbi:MAG: LON peptidase substrate-binding domain-containing protein [Actinocatenispora sp.]
MTETIPLFPLGTVLFPGVVLPLHIFEPRYRTLVRDLMDQPSEAEHEFGVVAIRQGAETGEHDHTSLYTIGCSARLKQVKTYPDGRFDIVTVGHRRFRLTGTDHTSAPYLRGEVDWLPDPLGTAGLADRLAPSVLAAFRRYLRMLAEASGTAESATGDPTTPGAVPLAGSDAGSEQLPEDPAVLAHLVAASTALTVPDRQRLLAAPDTATRLRAEMIMLRRETGLLHTLRAVPAPLSEFRVPTSTN